MIMPIKFYYIRFIRYFSKNGLKQVIKRMIEKSYQNIFKKNDFVFYQELTQLTEHDVQHQQNITIESKTNEKEIGKVDLGRLIQHIGEEIILTQLKERFAKAAVLWLIKVDDNLAGYVWSIGRSTLGPYYFPLCDNDAFLFDTSVFHAYRGNNIYPLLHTHVMLELKRRGVIRVIFDTHEWNIPIHKSLSKVKAKKLGIVRKYRFFGRNFILWKDNE
jgi:hypothetical protein